MLTFERGPEALKALQEVDPPVVMTDQRMPQMTGVEFLRHVKRLGPTQPVCCSRDTPT